MIMAKLQTGDFIDGDKMDGMSDLKADSVLDEKII